MALDYDTTESYTDEYHITVPGDDEMTPDEFEEWQNDLADLIERDMDGEYFDWIETGYDIDSESG